MPYTLRHILYLSAANAGLALQAQLYDDAGAAVGSAVTTGFFDRGRGNYIWLGTIPDAHTGWVDFHTAGGATYLTTTLIEPLELGQGGGDCPTAEEIWEYTPRTLTQSGAQVAAAVQGSTLVCLRGDTFVANLTDIGSLTGRDKLWFTVKRHRSDTDAQAIIQIIEGTGLVYLNGAAATAADGSLVVTDAASGDVTITIEATATDELRPSMGLDYDVQMLDGIVVTTRTEGEFSIPADVSRAVS